MISVDSLLYKIDLKLNNLTSLEHQEIPLENKILLLNEAQIKLIKNKLRQAEDNPLGFDADSKRYHDIQNLVEPASEHVLIPILKDKTRNKWTIDITELEPKMMFFIEGYLTADKGDCKNRTIVINPRLAKHADVSVLLSNSNTRPSFEWHETFNVMSSNMMEVYTDGTFSFKKAYLSYIRYPKEIDQVGYVKFDGTESVKQDSELESYLEDELLNIVIEEISIITEKQSGVEASPIRKAGSE